MFEYLRTLFSEPFSFFDQAIYRVLAVLVGLCFHEFAHAYVAYRCGDDTAKKSGRMTLNPLAHLDPFGTLMMFFAGFGYAKPVPVNPYKFRGNKVKADLMVSLAGIVMNTLLFVFFTYLCVLVNYYMWDSRAIQNIGISKLMSFRYNLVWEVISGEALKHFGMYMIRPFLFPLARFLSYTSLINLNLAVFNLIPIPPLDGYHVVNDMIFRGKIHLSAVGFRIAMVVVLVLAAQGILGGIIYAVVFPVQQVVLLPVEFFLG